MNKSLFKKCFPAMMVLVFMVAMAVPVRAESSDAEPAVKCFVLISMKIKPYLDAVQGIKSYFSGRKEIDLEFIILDTAKKEWGEKPSLPKEGYQRYACIAVGPEAVLYLEKASLGKDVFKFYSMILDPGAIISQQERFCGIFLIIDAKAQIRKIQEKLPGIKRLGVIYDPRYNGEYVKKAVDLTMGGQLTVYPLEVRNKIDVPDILRANWNNLDALLMIPDHTVISSSLVKFIIKDGLSNKVPVIGYNQFFISSGALMAFVYDYTKMGADTAKLVEDRMMNDTECVSRPGEFNTVVNKNIAHQLGIDNLK